MDYSTPVPSDEIDLAERACCNQVMEQLASRKFVELIHLIIKEKDLTMPDAGRIDIILISSIISYWEHLKNNRAVTNTRAGSEEGRLFSQAKSTWNTEVVNLRATYRARTPVQQAHNVSMCLQCYSKDGETIWRVTVL